MHDGYVYTLGICGSAAANSPAPALLDALLAALPPVKRAALLGEVVPLDANGRLSDPLVPLVVNDMRDAELILIVTPVSASSLPLRLTVCLDYAEPLATASMLRGKVAILVGISSHRGIGDVAFQRLQQFCENAGMSIADATLLTADRLLDPDATDVLKAVVQRAYTQIHQRIPYALP